VKLNKITALFAAVTVAFALTATVGADSTVARLPEFTEAPLAETVAPLPEYTKPSPSAVSSVKYPVNLPITPTAVNNNYTKGWLTDGYNYKTANLKIEALWGAKYLVLELGAKPTGETIYLVWQGDADGYAWNQSDIKIADVLVGDTTIVFELSKDLRNYRDLSESAVARIIVGYYDPDWDALGITKAYLSDVKPGTDTTSAVSTKPTIQMAIAALKLSINGKAAADDIAKYDYDKDGKITSKDAIAILKATLA